MLTRIAWPIAALDRAIFWISARGIDGEMAAGQHLHAVVGDVEEDVLEIERFARNVDRKDLPAAVAGQLLPVGEARDQDSAAGRQLTFANRVAAGREGFHRVRQREDGLAIVVGQRRAQLETIEEQLERIGGHWVRPAELGAGALSNSQPLKPGRSVQRLRSLNILRMGMTQHKIDSAATGFPNLSA